MWDTLVQIINSFVAQDLTTFFFRTWNYVVPITSSTTSEYAQFNTVDSSHGLYYLNQTLQRVPAVEHDSRGSGSEGLDFQLYIPSNSTELDELSNSAAWYTLTPPPNPLDGNDDPIDQDPYQLVTPDSTTTNFQTLNPESDQWNFATNSTPSYIVITESNISCILKGTGILTPEGYRKIEDIEIGEYIVTHDGRVKQVINAHVTNAVPSKTSRCIVIRKGTFGAIEDLYISQNHAVLIGDEFVLLNKHYPDKFEHVKGKSMYTYYSIMTDNYLTDSLVANGVPVETWGGYLPWKKNFKYRKPVIRNEKRNRVLEKKIYHPCVVSVFGNKHSVDCLEPYRLLFLNVDNTVIVLNAIHESSIGNDQRIKKIFIGVQHEDRWQTNIIIPTLNEYIKQRNDCYEIDTVAKLYHSDTYTYKYTISIKKLPVKFIINCEPFNNCLTIDMPIKYVEHSDGYMVTDEMGYSVNEIEDTSQ